MKLVLFICRTVLSVQFGALEVGQFSAYTPDYVKAKFAAGRMFKLFDRIPTINSDSGEGLHPVSSYCLLEMKQEQVSLEFFGSIAKNLNISIVFNVWHAICDITEFTSVVRISYLTFCMATYCSFIYK